MSGRGNRTFISIENRRVKEPLQRSDISQGIGEKTDFQTF